MKSVSQSTAENNQFKRISHRGWSGMVNVAHVGLFEGDDSDWPAVWLDEDSEQVSPADRKGVQVYEAPIGQLSCYVKHFTSKKSGAAQVSLLSRLIWRFGASRAQQNLKANAKLQEAGFGTAAVLLAVRRTKGLEAEDLFITRRVEGETFHHALLGANDVTKKDLLERMGKCIADLHSAGFIHGDLLPRNMMIEHETQGIVFLDNDRTRKWGLYTPRWQKWRNIEQLMYRLLVYHPYRTLKPLIRHYISHSPYPPVQARRYAATAIKRVRQRWVDYAQKLDISNIPEDIMPDESRRWRIEIHTENQPRTEN